MTRPVVEQFYQMTFKHPHKPSLSHFSMVPGWISITADMAQFLSPLCNFIKGNSCSKQIIPGRVTFFFLVVWYDTCDEISIHEIRQYKEYINPQGDLNHRHNHRHVVKRKRLVKGSGGAPEDVKKKLVAPHHESCQLRTQIHLVACIKEKPDEQPSERKFITMRPWEDHRFLKDLSHELLDDMKYEKNINNLGI